MHVAANNVTIIPPLSHGQVIGTIAKDPKKQYRLPLSTKELTTYVVKNGTQPGLQTLPWIMDYIRPNQVCIPVYNSTPYDMIIEKNMFVADIEIMHNLNEFEMHSMSMSEVPHDVIETNHAAPAFVEPDVIEINHVRPRFIQDDEGMNEEEKEEAFLHYMKFGYHHPSMTKEVEENAALTALLLPVRGALPLHVDALSAQINVAAASSLTNNVRPASKLVTRLSIVTCWLLPFSLNVTKSPLRMQRATRSNRSGSLAGGTALANLPVPHAKSCAPTAMR